MCGYHTSLRVDHRGSDRVPDSSTGECAGSRIRWPRKHDLFGVPISATSYDEAVSLIMRAAEKRDPAVASFFAAHAVVTASGDPELRKKVSSFQMAAPDGQPVRWALNRLYGVGLKDRVYGPELMLRLCRQAAQEGVSVYLYGGSPSVVERLRENLVRRFPGLAVVGAESPPFRALSPEEDADVVRRINESGAGVVFIGLGCPKQDHFAYDHGDRIRGVQVCVGAAFDFHAGVKKMAPPWMQRCGVEWLFRLASEPRRLWRRYLVTNTLFAAKFAAQWTRWKTGPRTRRRLATTKSKPEWVGQRESLDDFHRRGPTRRRLEQRGEEA